MHVFLRTTNNNKPPRLQNLAIMIIDHQRTYYFLSEKGEPEFINGKKFTISENISSVSHRNEVLDVLALRYKYLAYKNASRPTKEILEKYNSLTRKCYLLNNIPWNIALCTIMLLLSVVLLLGSLTFFYYAHLLGHAALLLAASTIFVSSFSLGVSLAAIKNSYNSFSKRASYRRFFKEAYNEDIEKVDAGTYRIGIG